MDNIASIVNLIATAITARLTLTLSQQIARSQQQRGGRHEPSWLQRIAGRFGFGGGPATWMDRFSPGKMSPENQNRMDRSNRSHWAALQAHSDAKKRHQGALDEFEAEKKNPTGKDLAKLQLAIIDYESALKEATEKLKETTKAHEKVKTEVNRQTKWQQERTKGNLWSPGQALAKGQQRLRIFRRQMQRWRGSSDAASKAKRAYQVAQTAHRKNLAQLSRARSAKAGIDKAKQIANATRSGLRAARQAIQTATSPQKLVEAHKGLQAARAAHAESLVGVRGARAAVGRAGTVASATKAAAASGRAVAATGAAATAAAGASRAAAGAAMARGVGLAASAGPYAAAAAAIAALIAWQVQRVKGWVDGQLRKSEALIDGQIRQRSQFSAQIAGAVARFDQQSLSLNMRNAAQTAGSASGVVSSTMRLREAQQPMSTRWENIGNKFEAYMTDTATHLQSMLNAVDFVTPAVESLVGLLELLPWVKAISDEMKKEENVGIASLRGAFEANKAQRANKAMPPIPPIK